VVECGDATQPAPGRIVPAHTALRTGLVELGPLVEHVGVVCERDEPVLEALGDVQRASGVGGELDREVTGKGR